VAEGVVTLSFVLGCCFVTVPVEVAEEVVTLSFVLGSAGSISIASRPRPRRDAMLFQHPISSSARCRCFATASDAAVCAEAHHLPD
jgi:hypothetical protein